MHGFGCGLESVVGLALRKSAKVSKAILSLLNDNFPELALKIA